MTIQDDVKRAAKSDMPELEPHRVYELLRMVADISALLGPEWKLRGVSRAHVSWWHSPDPRDAHPLAIDPDAHPLAIDFGRLGRDVFVVQFYEVDDPEVMVPAEWLAMRATVLNYCVENNIESHNEQIVS
jgi:hypothetical protein